MNRRANHDQMSCGWLWDELSISQIFMHDKTAMRINVCGLVKRPSSLSHPGTLCLPFHIARLARGFKDGHPQIAVGVDLIAFANR